MKKIIVLFLLASFFLQGRISAQNIDSEALDSFIFQVMSDFEVPGISVGIVRNDTVIYSKGFGIRSIEQSLMVDEETIFGIGSISKSFTALTLGLLVDKGFINWDDKVVDYLPYFELYDPYVTSNFTIRDLLTHKSGLKSVSGGTLWYHSDLTREQVIRGLKYLKPVSGFREKSAYQNVMFVVAGEIVNVVTNMSWDDFLKQHILEKMDMLNTTSISSIREANPNIARPHVWNKEITEKMVVEQELGDNLAAAGFIYSSAHDMINYMRLLLNDGTFQEDTIVSKSIIDEIFKPQSLFQISAPPFGNEFSSYGLGWWLTPYMGHKIIEHSGGIDGMTAQLFMVKDLNIGVVVLSNTSKEAAAFLIKSKLLQMIFNTDAFDIYDRAKKSRLQRIERMQNALNSIPKIENAPPSLELKDYAGQYTDRMFGDINLTINTENELEVKFSHTPLFSGRLRHWHYDTFKIEWYDVRIPPGYLTFNFDAKQSILGFNIEQENLLDVDFTELEILKKQ
jgi:CubicO group peptidase (beta-lactamase class C family)